MSMNICTTQKHSVLITNFSSSNTQHQNSAPVQLHAAPQFVMPNVVKDYFGKSGIAPGHKTKWFGISFYANTKDNPIFAWLTCCNWTSHFT